MKRSYPASLQCDDNYVLKTYGKLRRKLLRPCMWPLPIDSSESITELLKDRTVFVWFALKEIFTSFSLPIDIGTVLMDFYCTYTCNLCSTALLIQQKQTPTSCLQCYKYHNGDFGLVCHMCDISFVEKCIYCSYTECSDHFKPNHCASCDTFLCPRCNDREERVVCSSCYRHEFF